MKNGIEIQAVSEEWNTSVDTLPVAWQKVKLEKENVGL